MLTKKRTERKLERSGRITPREVLEAYEKTGLEAAVKVWYEKDPNGHEQACGITAVAMANGYRPWEGLIAFAGGVDDFIAERMPYVGEYYRSGFAIGFDGEPCPEPGTDDHPLMRGSEGWERLGWRDGRRAMCFVFKA